MKWSMVIFLMGVALVSLLLFPLIKKCSGPATDDATGTRTTHGDFPEVKFVGLDALEKELGIQKIRVSSTVKVQLAIFEWCGIGDVDGILLELGRAKNKDLSLTLEPILPEDPTFGASSAIVPLEHLKGGGNYALPLPDTQKRSAQLGLYLCLDSKRTMSCREKKIVDYNDIFDEASNDSKAEPSDKIYFFQPLLYNGGDTLAFSDKLEEESGVFPRLFEYVTAFQPLLNKENKIHEEMRRMEQLIDVIRSRPLEASRLGIVMKLALRNPARCQAH